MPLAPIVLFAYKRPLHLEATLATLQKNPLAAESQLIVFSDGAKNETEAALVQQCREVLRSVGGFAKVTVHEATHNQGLANSVIKGVSQVLAVHGKAIVLEDDMVSTPDFLNFMNDGLEYYQDHPKVFSLSGYSFPLEIPSDYPNEVYALPRASSWGWATWHDKWQLADWEMRDFEVFQKDRQVQQKFNQGGADLSTMLFRQQQGKIDSWAIRWIYAHFKHQALAVYPRQSRIQNIGLDGSGTHSPKTARYLSQIDSTAYSFVENPSIHPVILASLQRFFARSSFRSWVDYFQFGIRK